MNIHLPLLVILLAARSVLLTEFRNSVFCSALMVKLMETDKNLSFNAERFCGKDTYNLPNKFLTDVNSPITNLIEYIRFCSERNRLIYYCGYILHHFHRHQYSMDQAKDYYDWAVVSMNPDDLHICPKEAWEILKEDKVFDFKKCLKFCDENGYAVTEYAFKEYALWSKSLEGPKSCSCNSVRYIGFIFEKYLGRIYVEELTGEVTLELRQMFERICHREVASSWTDYQYSIIETHVKYSRYGAYTIEEISKALADPIPESIWDYPYANSVDIIYLISRLLVQNPKGPQLSYANARLVAINICKLEIVLLEHLNEFVQELLDISNKNKEVFVKLLDDLMPSLELVKEFSLNSPINHPLNGLREVHDFYNSYWKNEN